jgi:hypothetical protein
MSDLSEIKTKLSKLQTFCKDPSRFTKEFEYFILTIHALLTTCLNQEKNNRIQIKARKYADNLNHCQANEYILECIQCLIKTPVGTSRYSNMALIPLTADIKITC